MLRTIFGHNAFRAHQEGIVKAILSGRDAFVVMPTGGGKSLCYQLPACVLPGVCLVVSPLISLMKDQVDAAQAKGIAAAYLNSSQSDSEKRGVLERLTAGHLDLLYVAPERFPLPGFLERLKGMPICLVAIDEAHCISEWGHEFRPDYLELPRMLAHLPRVPVAAFTATATARVQRDIIHRLGLRSPCLVRASFDRPNLYYEVRAKGDINSQLLQYLRSHRGESGIIYRTTRKSVEETAESLARRGIRALPYHAGLDTETRKRNQDAFDSGEAEVVVATIAFGMGIDKPDVRYVIHGELPRNMERYYQETGRAGRDGAPAHCLLFFDWGDLPTLRYFIKQIKNESERRIADGKLKDMIDFAESRDCRRRRILGYFGEHYPGENCGMCDNCVRQKGKHKPPPEHRPYRSYRAYRTYAGAERSKNKASS
ncbi:MAG: ATP-dependent DNA helicase RecQ [Kiritimatiellae bacterium]|nr:ATP-dependent DNA helicase RecQ [Kiritimatiellia bacterium]